MYIFVYWVEIIFRNFYEVFVIFVLMVIDMFVIDLIFFMKVYFKLELNKYYWLYFKIFIVVIGGICIFVMMFRRD